MPYSGPSDDSLPANVKEMPEKVRAQWVNVWNSSHRRCMDDGGSAQQCEEFAFRNANGVARKRMMVEVAEVLSPYLNLEPDDVHVDRPLAYHGDHMVKCPDCGHRFKVRQGAE